VSLYAPGGIALLALRLAKTTAVLFAALPLRPLLLLTLAFLWAFYGMAATGPAWLKARH
jgi:hypothetical protein